MTTAHKILSEQDRITYSVQEASALSGISVSTIKYHIYTGLLPAKKVGKRWVIPAKALRDYLGWEWA